MLLPYFTQKGGKTYFKESIRDKFAKLRYAKDYIKSGFDSFKNKVLEWKGRMLRAKGYFLAQKGDDLIKYAYSNSKGKGKGYSPEYYDDSHGELINYNQYL